MAKSGKGGGARTAPRTISNVKKISAPSKGAPPGPKSAGGGTRNTNGTKGC